MKILLTSVGRRSYLVKYFKDALGSNGEIHVSNSTSVTPAFTYADKSIVTPLIYDKEYIPFLLKYCSDNKIDAIISLFDVDLPVLSENKQFFNDIGTHVIVSNESVVHICNDKLETFRFLTKNGFKTPKTYVSLNAALDAIRAKQIDYPVIIKPRWGMGSIGVFDAENENELNVLYNKAISKIKNSYLKYESQKKLEESVLIQEKLCGQEYGLDIINDLNGRYKNTIVKKKYAMRSGETDCAETVYNPVLKNIGELIGKKLKHIANLDVDIFLNDNIPYILEMNARFGGGYPFSHAAGVNLPLAIVRWLRGEQVDDFLLTEQIGVLAHKDIDIVNIDNSDKDIKLDKYYLIRVKTKQDIKNILDTFNFVFDPPILSRIDNFDDYAEKLKENAFVYVAKSEDNIIGFIAFYANDKISRTAYITFIAVRPFAQKKKVGKTLLELCLDISKQKGMSYIKLEVRKHNNRAIRFYKKYGFEFCGEASPESMYMIKKL